MKLIRKKISPSDSFISLANIGKTFINEADGDPYIITDQDIDKILICVNLRDGMHWQFEKGGTVEMVELDLVEK